MNKGIRLATGDIIGALKADDRLTDSEVITEVFRAFELQNIEIIYRSLYFISLRGPVNRRRVSEPCSKNSLNRGFIPPHPTFNCSHGYSSATDCELMLRFLYAHGASRFHLDKALVYMLAGGVSHGSFKNTLKSWKFDLKALRDSEIRLPPLMLILKPLRKLRQLLSTGWLPPTKFEGTCCD
ncbi:hypothetical protein LX99_04821 [Mucilaginibacter oryzae]|uniref:Uncharacterized protein n=1 Tax=Mucilaginibacter oryzae TaxID=468058 RepID=A0A316GYA1_9SPHI|nr:hypothetical protein [Mucilaginibacter oryzae]PWK68296.1 hypothetical protein LX99_04821 [Mucilaginibacter oryzae]